MTFVSLHGSGRNSLVQTDYKQIIDLHEFKIIEVNGKLPNLNTLGTYLILSPLKILFS